MADYTMNLDKLQLGRIEQIVLDSDEKEALKLIKEIHKKLKSGQVGCDPQGQRMRDRLDDVVHKFKK
ncbi:MAG: hypothetical protein A2Z02_06310 [Chloroflexi bacterium RBG_16_48_7]|nr:MAG: hypothetical protein A2Z02_06310 [Chloroflexi bacterium RBG_16_48_7]